MRLRGALLLAATAGVVGALTLAGPASAANLHCGQVLTGSVTLIGNLDCSSTTSWALRFDHTHPGVTLNLNGFKVTGSAGHHVINTDGAANITIKGGELDVKGDGIGIADFFGSSNLVVAGITIKGDGTTDSDGIYSDGSTGMSVTGGSISGVTYGVVLDGTTGDLVKGNTITPNDAGYGIDSDDDNTAEQIVSNKFTDTDSDGAGYALYADYDAGTLFSGNTVTDMGYGVYDNEYSAGMTITGNVMDGNEYGIYLDEYGSGDMIAGNYIKNSASEGVYDDYSFNNTYNGNVLTSNGSTANDESYYIDPDGYGPVTMVNNYARTGDGYGFYVYYAYNDSVPGGPYSLFSGNVATANGSSSAPGFYDEYSVGATWTKNVSNSNATDGFDFCAPWRETVTGNSATTNGGDGFYFAYASIDCIGDDLVVGPGIPDTIEDSQPLAVTNNSATNNGYVGFDADFPIAGSGNTGKSTNVYGDCYLVAGCS